MNTWKIAGAVACVIGASGTAFAICSWYLGLFSSGIAKILAWWVVVMIWIACLKSGMTAAGWWADRIDSWTGEGKGDR